MKNLFEKKLEILPDFEPDAVFVSRLYEDLKVKPKRYLKFNLNYFLYSSFIFFIACISISIGNIAKFNEKNTVKIQLTQRNQTAQNTGQSTVFIYDENNFENDVITDYKIIGNELEIQLGKGNYKVVVASNEFENLSTSLTIN